MDELQAGLKHGRYGIGRLARATAQAGVVVSSMCAIAAMAQVRGVPTVQANSEQAGSVAAGQLSGEGRRISLNFQDIEVRALLQLIADFSQFNIVSSDAVRGKITVRMRDLPWEQALQTILQAKGLAMVQQGTVIWVATRDELATRQRHELEERMAIERLEPLVTRSFQLNYARAQDVVAQLTGVAHLQSLAHAGGWAATQAGAWGPYGAPASSAWGAAWHGGHPSNEHWPGELDAAHGGARMPSATHGSHSGGPGGVHAGSAGHGVHASPMYGSRYGAPRWSHTPWGGMGASAARFLSPRGSAIAEPRTNQLFVTDVAARVEEVARILEKLDVPQRQVMIEARIVEASDTFGRSLGAKLGGGNVAVPSNNGHRNLIGTSYDLIASGGMTAAGSAAGNAGNTAAISHPAFINLPALGQGGNAPGTVAIALFNAASSRFIALELSALEAEGKGKLVSSPRVVTADKTRARIEQGTEFPYQVTDREGRINTSFKRATLKLDVVPQITPDGHVILDLSVHKDSRGETTTNGVAINTKQIATQVQVDNGGTVAIGGIFEIAENEGEARVPLLGELPGVGALFRSRQRNTSKQELLVFITPKVIEERSARNGSAP